MSINLDNRLIFNINNSLLVSAVLVGLHAGAFLIVLALPLAHPLQLLVAVLIIASLWSTLGQQGTRRAVGAIRGVEIDADGDWTLERHNRDMKRPCRACAYLVASWMVVVQLRCPGQWLPVNLLIAADAVDHHVFRRLRAAFMRPRAG
ncbi:MAG: protein YgfX [Acidiferrobacterales bacterium]